MAQAVRADLERLSRLANEVMRFSEVLEPRTVLMWVDTLPAALREEPSFKALVADLDDLRRLRSRLEQMVARLQRQMQHLREYLAGVEYSYQYAYRARAVSLPLIDYRAVCPQRYVVAAGAYDVPNAYASTARVRAVPDAGALERILTGWSDCVNRGAYASSTGLDDRLTADDGGSNDRHRDYGDPTGDRSRYST